LQKKYRFYGALAPSFMQKTTLSLAMSKIRTMPTVLRNPMTFVVSGLAADSTCATTRQQRRFRDNRAGAHPVNKTSPRRSLSAIMH
jgi:hypothetical protein